jgi:hypothetical protein
MVRRQAAFHSVLVICVSRSQKPMQAASVLPPPPGALGADSLGLDEDVPGERARLLGADPLVANCVGSCGDSGATGASSGMGAAIADGVVVTSGAGGGADVLMVTVERVAGTGAGAAVVFGGVVAGGRGTARVGAEVGCRVMPAEGACGVEIGAGVAGERDTPPPCPPPRALAAPDRSASVRRAVVAKGQEARKADMGLPSVSGSAPMLNGQALCNPFVSA